MRWSQKNGPMKAPRGVNIPLGPFSSTFQELPFLYKKQVNFQKGGHHEDKDCCIGICFSRFPYRSCSRRTAAGEGPQDRLPIAVFLVPLGPRPHKSRAFLKG